MSSCRQRRPTKGCYHPVVTGGGPQIDDDFLRKLGLKPGGRLGVVAAPDAWLDALSALTPVESWRDASAAAEADVTLVWLTPFDDLRAAFDALEARIATDGAVWAVIPKKSALARGEAAVEWATLQSAGLASGRLVDNKELRFDNRYYGTRFVVRKERRQ